MSQKTKLYSYFVIWLIWPLSQPIAVSESLADTLHVGVTAMPSARLNPWASPNVPGVFILSSVFDGLTRLDPDGTPAPWLAVSWSANADASNWTFRLREEVRFSNGRKMKASDVVLALDFLTSPGTTREVLAAEFDHVVEAVALDDETVEIRLLYSDVLFPRTVSQLLIPDSESWASLGPEGFAQAPVGTGPFKVDRLTSEQIILSSFDESWRSPKVKGLEFYVLTEPATRLNGLLSDRLDITFDMSRDDIGSIQQSGGTLYQATLPSVLGLVLISTRPESPLYKKQVRQALNYAVDVEALSNVVTGGLTSVASQTAHRTAFGYNSSLEPYGYNPARARELLEEAGYGSGFEMTADVSVSGLNIALVLQKIAEDLQEVGVDLTFQTISFPTFASHFRTGNWDGDAFNFLFSTEPNLDALRGIKYYSCAWPGLWYCNPDITPLIEAAYRADEINTRRTLTESVMARYRDEAPAIILYEFPYVFGLRAPVRGFSVTHSFIPWHQVSIAP